MHALMAMRPREIDRAAERVVRYLPEPAATRARYVFRRRALERLLQRRLGARYTPVDPGPVAPPELVEQTSVLYAHDLPAAAERYDYLAGGYLGMLTILRTLERFGFDIASARAVLDFGCGAAKSIRLLRGADGLRLVGTDVNPRQIEWAREHVPGVELHVNGLEPPLAFAEPNSFDLVIAASVFTHIPIELQRPWLEEIRRVLAPGGYFFCTVAGAYHIGVQLSPELRERLEREGSVTLEADDPGISHATKAAGSWDVFQTRAEVERSFGSVFELLFYSETLSTGAQDNLVLRKAS